MKKQQDNHSWTTTHIYPLSSGSTLTYWTGPTGPKIMATIRFL